MNKSVTILFILILSAVAVSIAASSSSSLNFLTKGLADKLYDTSGWIEYSDKQYTTANRLTIGTTAINFTMTNYTTRQQELPDGVTNLTWFNGSHILTERAGNTFLYRFRYKAEPQIAGVYCESWLDIDGAVGKLPLRFLSFPRGVGVETIGTFTNLEYTLDSWKQNGARMTIECSGDVEFWDIELTIQRLHEGRGTY